MTYTAFEASDEQGEPIELFRFDAYNGTWLFCSGETDTAYDGDTYLARPISRGAIESSQDMAKNTISMTAPRDNPLVRAIVDASPPGMIWLTIYRGHRDDGEFVVAWNGRVTSVSQADAVATIKAESIMTSLDRVGLRPQYQLQCRHTLYGPGCTLDKSVYMWAGTVETVIGTQVIVAAASAKPDGWFAGGVLMTSDGVRRTIYLHTGTSITLSAPMPGLAAGTAIVLYPGCAQTLSACDLKFGNTENYGGAPWMPIKNPFSGDAIM